LDKGQFIGGVENNRQVLEGAPEITKSSLKIKLWGGTILEKRATVSGPRGRYRMQKPLSDRSFAGGESRNKPTRGGSRIKKKLQLQPKRRTVDRGGSHRVRHSEET